MGMVEVNLYNKLAAFSLHKENYGKTDGAEIESTCVAG